MDRYQFFHYLAAIGWYGAGIAGILGFVFRSRTGTWLSRSCLTASGAIMFFIPLGVFANLLSKPLHDQSFFHVCFWSGLLCLYLLLGAIGIVRSPRTRSVRQNSTQRTI
jgi:hypothetical protein